MVSEFVRACAWHLAWHVRVTLLVVHVHARILCTHAHPCFSCVRE